MPFVMELYNSDTGWFIEKLFLEDGYVAVNSVNTNAPGYDLITWGDYDWKEYNDDKIKMVYANSPHPLLNDDELVFENNMIKVIQKNAFNFATNQWESLLQPIEYNLGAVELPTYENETYITMKYFDNVSYWAEYIEDNEFTRNYQTQVESKGQINVSSRQLVLKVDSNGHIAETELWADPKTGSRIKLKADDINLEGYTTINEGFSVDLKGNATMQNATILGSEVRLADNTEIIGGRGLLTNLRYEGTVIANEFVGSGWIPWGYQRTDDTRWEPAHTLFSFNIPDNFIVVSAKVSLFHAPVVWTDFGAGTNTGYLRNIRLYKGNVLSRVAVNSLIGVVEYDTFDSLSEITNAFGSSGFTGSSSSLTSATSIDIKEQIHHGLNNFVLRTSDGNQTTQANARVRSGATNSFIEIIGYLKP